MSLGASGKLGVLGGILAIVGAVLPWWNVSASAGGMVSLSLPVLGIFTLGGILALVLGILGLVFATRKPSVPMGALVLVFGVLVAVVSMVWGAMLPTASVNAGVASASLTAGFGYWLSLVGGIVLLAAGALDLTEARKTQAPAPTA